ncbi:helix-hairpin-helix domain-containing protein [Tannerella forsythia]|uniref:Helix-hairpin-helix motif protein n=1 Tax=Tannerella forsythia TaxID=28112 RepID=A0A1D3ULI3_TANFO|nr:helix-hairpin-helix domain-containing protein [Tannerella forsythia]SCQ20227.1 Helix-hairpin-helix motif protein [Tannerella forsythia]SCQ20961.1 Helix-hairpin-helix motif protein [Tannerella forsythia]
MDWRDFFYFSRGERRGLIVLLCLIALAGILMLLKSPSSDQEQPTHGDTTSVRQMSPANTSEGPADYPTAQPPRQPAGRPRPAASRTHETTGERIKRLTDPRPRYPRTQKLPQGSTLELNTADTTDLRKIPGIGSTFSKRIVKYRNLLGGYADVSQLAEVYGIDEEKYTALAPWFTVDPTRIRRLNVNRLPEDSLRRHPYIDYRQAKLMVRLRRQQGGLTGWHDLMLLEEFTDADRHRLEPYLSFEK